MILSQLYSNQPKIFEPITFNDGLNFVVAEIRLPGNTAEDTHNLGKSTLRDLINFCLISKKDKDFFLFSNQQFEYFIFYLELKLLDDSFLTIRRTVSSGTKISFKTHKERNQNFNNLPPGLWDHFEVGYDKSKQLLDSYLNLSEISPYSFRKVIGYLLRSQTGYSDPFDLNFKGAHSDWKPLLAKILGLDSNNVEQSYKLEQELNELKSQKTKLVPIDNSSISEIEGLIALKSQTLNHREKELETLDFTSIDQVTSDTIVTKLGVKIQELNNNIYYTKANLQQIEQSLSESKVKFNLSETQQLFNEIGIVFNDQVVKNYSQLVDFHNDIMKERRAYLIKEKKRLESLLQHLSEQLKEANLERSNSLDFLKSNNILDRYKTIANEIAAIKNNINQLQDQSKIFHEAKELQLTIRDKEASYEKLIIKIEDSIETATSSNAQSKFAKIRLNFSNIINAVISEPAMLSVKLNNENHLSFSAKLLDATGNKTSADKGNSYKKLLCVAFDLALLQTYNQLNFPHFVFHDGVFETLDDRKKENLLSEMRDISNQGIQQIVTMIDSDTPNEYGQAKAWLSSSEIILFLHDDGEKGRLFKMPTW